MNESEMIEQIWPGGKQPVTDQPYFIINSQEDWSSKNIRAGGTYTSPVSISIYCPTQGASLVYQWGNNPQAGWKFYAGPFYPEKGEHRIRVKAIRYGYRESEELEEVFDIR